MRCPSSDKQQVKQAHACTRSNNSQRLVPAHSLVTSRIARPLLVVRHMTRLVSVPPHDKKGWLRLPAYVLGKATQNSMCKWSQSQSCKSLRATARCLMIPRFVLSIINIMISSCFMGELHISRSFLYRFLIEICIGSIFIRRSISIKRDREEYHRLPQIAPFRSPGCLPRAAVIIFIEPARISGMSGLACNGSRFRGPNTTGNQAWQTSSRNFSARTLSLLWAENQDFSHVPNPCHSGSRYAARLLRKLARSRGVVTCYLPR